MVSLSEQTTIAAPLGAVWPLLSDPALVAACIPGAQLAPDQGDGLWRGSVRVKFGPTVAVFRGEATLAFDHEAKRCTIEGRGIDQRGASRALANGVVTAADGEGETTLLAIEGGFSITGPLETFANAGGVHVARALLAEFSSNMARLVAERHAAEPPPPPPASAADSAAVTAEASLPGGPSAAAGSAAAAAAAAPPSPAPPRPGPVAARELSAAKLLWRAFLSWLRDLFGKRKT